MPFTPAHVAAVLPLWRTRLPMEALAIGAVTPDLLVFISRDRFYDLTHSPLGVVSINLAVGCLALAAWLSFFRAPLRALAPEYVQRRTVPTRKLSSAQWRAVPLALMLGAASHVLWDSFTHPGRWGVRQFPALLDVYAGKTGFAWLQTISGVMGVAIVVLVWAWWLAGEPRRYAVSELSWPWAMWLLPLAPVAWIGGGVAEQYWIYGLEAVAFHVITETAAIAGLGITGLAGLWHVLRWRSRAR